MLAVFLRLALLLVERRLATHCKASRFVENCMTHAYETSPMVNAADIAAIASRQ